MYIPFRSIGRGMTDGHCPLPAVLHFNTLLVIPLLSFKTNNKLSESVCHFSLPYSDGSTVVVEVVVWIHYFSIDLDYYPLTYTVYICSKSTLRQDINSKAWLAYKLTLTNDIDTHITLTFKQLENTRFDATCVLMLAVLWQIQT